jgi:hypothetical protein
MLFERQKCLLALVDSLGGDVGALDFQKLLFLYCREVETTPSYEFVPYHFGGFSFTSYADKRRLIDQGLLVEEERCWKLTPAGRRVANVAPMVRMRMDQFAKCHAKLRGDALVAEAYRRHPFHAIRSEMAERVLAGEAGALAAINAVRPAPGLPGVCTIGYEGSSLEGYLNRLLNASVTLLCDVRRNPLSRKYGFSKSTLAKSCEGLGIRYEHLPELGIASDERQQLRVPADYEALFAAYKRDNLPRQNEALKKIAAWVQDGQRVALTCFERLPEHCHRHCVAESLVRTFGRKFAPQHL